MPWPAAYGVEGGLCSGVRGLALHNLPFPRRPTDSASSAQPAALLFSSSAIITGAYDHPRQGIRVPRNPRPCFTAKRSRHKPVRLGECSSDCSQVDFVPGASLGGPWWLSSVTSAQGLDYPQADRSPRLGQGALSVPCPGNRVELYLQWVVCEIRWGILDAGDVITQPLLLQVMLRFRNGCLSPNRWL